MTRDEKKVVTETKDCRAEAVATSGSPRPVPKPDWLTIAIAAVVSAILAILLR
jgi:hypothetical protein